MVCFGFPALKIVARCHTIIVIPFRLLSRTMVLGEDHHVHANSDPDLLHFTVLSPMIVDNTQLNYRL